MPNGTLMRDILCLIIVFFPFLASFLQVYPPSLPINGGGFGFGTLLYWY
jgi:hypothetical protein